MSYTVICSKCKKERQISKRQYNRIKKTGNSLCRSCSYSINNAWKDKKWYEIPGIIAGCKHSPTEKERNNLSNRMKGENNPQWKGGITSLYKYLRNWIYNYDWKEFMHQRLGDICYFCGEEIKGSFHYSNLVLQNL
jgi:hypothetical protein